VSHFRSSFQGSLASNSTTKCPPGTLGIELCPPSLQPFFLFMQPRISLLVTLSSRTGQAGIGFHLSCKEAFIPVFRRLGSEADTARSPASDYLRSRGTMDKHCMTGHWPEAMSCLFLARTCSSFNLELRHYGALTFMAPLPVSWQAHRTSRGRSDRRRPAAALPGRHSPVHRLPRQQPRVSQLPLWLGPSQGRPPQDRALAQAQRCAGRSRG